MSANTKTAKIAEVKRMCRAISKKKEELARGRDELRDLLSETETLIENLDSGLDSVAEGVRLIESGLDAISGTI